MPSALMPHKCQAGKRSTLFCAQSAGGAAQAHSAALNPAASHFAIVPAWCSLQGWSPERAKHFGAALLPAVYEMLPMLRAQ
jgi:hypothetical protein